MEKRFLKVLGSFIVLCFFLMLTANLAKAQPYEWDYSWMNNNQYDTDDMTDRYADWYNVETNTTAWGATETYGRFGPDYGIGEEGYRYEYSDPMTGSYTSYSSTSMGSGLMGGLLGYQGMYSQNASNIYGPYAYGNEYQASPTWGWDTQGSTYGDAWGRNYNYSNAQPNFYAMGMQSLLGFGSGFGFNNFGFNNFGSNFGNTFYPNSYQGQGNNLQYRIP